MKQKISEIILAVYDIFLSLGAIYMGIMMILSNGMFAEYPKEWLPKVPFENWIAPGLISIIVFGLGNILAAIFSLRAKCKKSWHMSAIMGGVFFVSLIVQILVLGKAYLVTVEFFVLSIIQLCLCGYIFRDYRKNSMNGNI